MQDQFLTLALSSWKLGCQVGERQHCFTHHSSYLSMQGLHNCSYKLCLLMCGDRWCAQKSRAETVSIACFEITSYIVIFNDRHWVFCPCMLVWQISVFPVATVFEISFDLPHLWACQFVEPCKFCLDCGEVTILSGAFNTTWHGAFCQYHFVKLDKSHHHCREAVSIAALNMGIELILQ